jgi:hypothetical protein
VPPASPCQATVHCGALSAGGFAWARRALAPRPALWRPVGSFHHAISTATTHATPSRLDRPPRPRSWTFAKAPRGTAGFSSPPSLRTRARVEKSNRPIGAGRMPGPVGRPRPRRPSLDSRPSPARGSLDVGPGPGRVVQPACRLCSLQHVACMFIRIVVGMRVVRPD